MSINKLCKVICAINGILGTAAWAGEGQPVPGFAQIALHGQQAPQSIHLGRQDLNALLDMPMGRCQLSRQLTPSGEILQKVEKDKQILWMKVIPRQVLAKAQPYYPFTDETAVYITMSDNNESEYSSLTYLADSRRLIAVRFVGFTSPPGLEGDEVAIDCLE